MKLNVSKTKELRAFFSIVIPSFAPITVRGQEVDVVSEAKLLGVVLSDDLKWSRHIDYTFARKPRSVCMVCAFLKEMLYLLIS